jgi:hypothetical protein
MSDNNNNFFERARAGLEKIGARPQKTKLPIYYLNGGKGLYVRETPEGFIIEKLDALRRHLKKLGYCADRMPGERLSEIDEVLVYLHNHQSIQGILESGILPKGINILENGETVLVTLGADKTKAKEGNFPIIDCLIKQLFGRNPLQIEYVLGWLQGGVFSLYLNKHKPGQFLCLVGPPNAGKSLFQSLVITKLLGNRSVNPFPWLSKQVQFNAELFVAMHLQMEDEFVNGEKKEKVSLSRMVKKIVSVELQPYYRKHQPNCFSTNPHWMLSASFNREPHCLACLPEFTSDIVDKLIVTDCDSVDFEGLFKQFEIPNDRDALAERISAEIPAMLHYLLYKHELRPELQHSRHHVCGYVAPAIAELCYSYSEEGELYGILRGVYQGGIFEKSEYQIARALEESGCRGAVSRYRKSASSLVPFLQAMAKRFPTQIRFLGRLQGEPCWGLDFRDMVAK